MWFLNDFYLSCESLINDLWSLKDCRDIKKSVNLCGAIHTFLLPVRLCKANLHDNIGCIQKRVYGRVVGAVRSL